MVEKSNGWGTVILKTLVGAVITLFVAGGGGLIAWGAISTRVEQLEDMTQAAAEDRKTMAREFGHALGEAIDRSVSHAVAPLTRDLDDFKAETRLNVREQSMQIQKLADAYSNIAVAVAKLATAIESTRQERIQ